MQELKELLWEFFQEHKTLFLMSILFLFIVPLHDVGLPLLYGKVVENLTKGKSIVFALVLVTIGILVLQFLDFASDYHDTRILPKLQSFIRQRTLLKILDKHEDAIAELEIGAINTKLVKLPAVITNLFERTKNFVIPHMLLHMFAIGLFFYVDKYMALILTVTIFVLYSIIIRGPSRCDRTSVKRDAAFDSLHEEIDDNLRNLFSIYGANQKDKEIDRIRKFNDAYNSLYKETIMCSFGLRAFVFPIIIIFIMVLMYRISCLIKSKKVKTSRFIPVFFVTMYIINSFMALDENLKHVIFDWGVVKSSMKLLKPLDSKQTKPMRHAALPQYARSGIGLYDVSFKYSDSAKMNLQDATIHINHGEAVGIVGDIGSGKSTVLKLLLGYYKPLKGTVYYNGTSYDNIPLSRIRQMIGYVPQVPVLFNRSILENITYGNPNVSRREVEALLNEIGLLDEFASMKNGLDTRVGKNGSGLSGGQRQLVWVLRVILSKPETIIFDEPTSSMDEKSKNRLRYLLDKYFKGKTIIMVTHDPSILTFAEKIIVMQQGRVVQVQKAKES